MKISVWSTSRGGYDVCNGPGPTGVIGHVSMDGGAWIINEDASRGRFVELDAAVRSIEATEQNFQWYLLARESELHSVRTCPDLLKEAVEDEWILAGSDLTLEGLERKRKQAFPPPDSI